MALTSVYGQTSLRPSGPSDPHMHPIYGHAMHLGPCPIRLSSTGRATCPQPSYWVLASLPYRLCNMAPMTPCVPSLFKSIATSSALHVQHQLHIHQGRHRQLFDEALTGTVTTPWTKSSMSWIVQSWGSVVIIHLIHPFVHSFCSHTCATAMSFHTTPYK